MIRIYLGFCKLNSDDDTRYFEEVHSSYDIVQMSLAPFIRAMMF